MRKHLGHRRKKMSWTHPRRRRKRLKPMSVSYKMSSRPIKTMVCIFAFLCSLEYLNRWFSTLDTLDVPAAGSSRERSRQIFDIPFEVPYKNATRDLRAITSATSFSEFLKLAAEKMGTKVTHLTELGYIASYKPKTPKPVPKMLDDEEAWEGLIDDVSSHLKASKTKKPFTILVLDMSGSDDKATPASKKVKYCSSFVRKLTKSFQYL